MATLYGMLAELSEQAKKYARGEAAGQRFMPTLGEAEKRIEALRAGTPLSEAGPGMRVPTAGLEDYLSGSLDATTPLPLGALTFEKAVREVPGFSRLGKYMTDDERALLESPQWRKFGTKVVDVSRQVPSPAERAAVATAGGAKRGWYRDSEKAIRQIFENQQYPDDPERFTALLAALSPQTSVQSNLRNALETWKNWTAAGRPRNPERILEVMGKSVEGDKGVESVLGAWRNNAYRALGTDDARQMLGPTGLSGPKVQSFFNNLMGISDEVTNDAWMAKLAGINQELFGGATRKGFEDPVGSIGIKGPGYIAENIASRRGAELLDWDPMEMQETGWSFGKTLLDLAQSPESVRKSMTEFGVPIPPMYQGLTPTTAVEALKGGLLTDEAIAAVPAFGDLVSAQPYRGILESAGMSPTQGQLPRPVLTSPYERLGVGPGELHTTPQGRHVLRAARRLDLSTERTDALARLDAAREYQRLAQTAKEKRQADQALAAARRQLQKSVRQLPNVTLDPEYRAFLQ